jgi:DNA-binding XRE family transcriptional regulator
MPSQSQSGLAKAVRQLRDERGWTQEDLAHGAGLRTGAVSAIERGKSDPKWTTVQAIATALEVSTADLAARAEKLEGR